MTDKKQTRTIPRRSPDYIETLVMYCPNCREPLDISWHQLEAGVEHTCTECVFTWVNE